MYSSTHTLFIPSISEGNKIHIGDDVFERRYNFISLRDVLYSYSHLLKQYSYLFSSVQSLSCVQLFVTPWTTACQASLSTTDSWSLLKLMSIEAVMPSNHLILCCPFLLLPSIFPSILLPSDRKSTRLNSSHAT